MPHAPGHSVAAMNYAAAVMDLAAEAGQVEQVAAELRELAALAASEDQFAQFFRNPAIGAARRWAVLERTFAGRVAPVVLGLLRVLNSRRRLGLMEAVAAAFEKLLDERHGRIRVDVTVARLLDEALAAEAAARIGAAMRKTAQLRQTVDESIIGGIVIRIEDKLIDGSVRSQLEQIRRRMAAAP